MQTQQIKSELSNLICYLKQSYYAYVIHQRLSLLIEDDDLYFEIFVKTLQECVELGHPFLHDYNYHLTNGVGTQRDCYSIGEDFQDNVLEDLENISNQIFEESINSKLLPDKKELFIKEIKSELAYQIAPLARTIYCDNVEEDASKIIDGIIPEIPEELERFILDEAKDYFLGDHRLIVNSPWFDYDDSHFYYNIVYKCHYVDIFYGLGNDIESKNFIPDHTLEGCIEDIRDELIDLEKEAYDRYEGMRQMLDNTIFEWNEAIARLRLFVDQEAEALSLGNVPQTEEWKKLYDNRKIILGDKRSCKMAVADFLTRMFQNPRHLYTEPCEDALLMRFSENGDMSYLGELIKNCRTFWDYWYLLCDSNEELFGKKILKSVAVGLDGICQDYDSSDPFLELFNYEILKDHDTGLPLIPASFEIRQLERDIEDFEFPDFPNDEFEPDLNFYENEEDNI